MIRIIIREDSYTELLKAFGVKYKHKELINGKWRYYYADKREVSVRWYQHNATKQELRTFIKDTIKNPNYIENIKLCDLPSSFSNRLKRKLGVDLNSLTMGSNELRHTLNHSKHKVSPEDILTFRRVIQNKHTIIRWQGESKKQKRKLISFKGYLNGRA